MIIIVGDSWGVGEWDHKCYLNGPGFGQYLMLHDQVINLSLGSGSNTDSLDRLDNLLIRFKPSVDDTVYWIVTCPSRCQNMYYFLESNQSIFLTAQDLLHKNFKRAQDICDRNQIKICIIGGLCDVCDMDFSAYDRLFPSVPSWCQLVDPSCPTCLIDPDWWGDFGKEIRVQRYDLMEEWINLSQKILDKQRAMKKMFTTDGAHPDRHAHKILRDYFYPEWAYKC